MKKVAVLEGNIADRERVLKKIKDSLTDDYDTIIFDNKDHYDYVSQIVTEISCFAEDRLFILKDLPKIDAPNAAQARTKVLGRFKKLFPIIPAGNIIVFDNVGVSAESFFKEVRKYGEVYKFDQKVDKSDGKRIVNEYFKEYQIVLDDSLSQLLVDSLNLNGNDVDVDKFHLTIKKFHQYVHGKSKITKEDVHAVCSSSADFIIWSLYNMLDDISASENKDIGSAVVLVNDFLDNAKYFEQEAVLMINGMIWRYGLLLMAKDGVNNRMSQKEINDKISNINKLESKGRSYRIKMKPKRVKDSVVPMYSYKMINSVMNQNYGKVVLSCYNGNQLLLIYYTLIKILIKIRSGCVNSEIKIAIHMIISVICGGITKQNTIDGILGYKKMLFGTNE